MQKKGTLPYLTSRLESDFSSRGITNEHLWYAVRGALDTNLLISNIAEALRISADETERLLIEHGFGDAVAQHRLNAMSEAAPDESQLPLYVSSEAPSFSFQDLFTVEFSPLLAEPINFTSAKHDSIFMNIENVLQSISSDAFLPLYREGVSEYCAAFMESDAVKIDEYISDKFGGEYPRYIVNSGIGANEQFNHFLSRLNNRNPSRVVDWLVIDSPRHLSQLPPDASVGNTLFMEFSRSGKTEETVKIHEYTPRDAHRVVFANSGPLRDIGVRDNDLVLDLPDQISGRFGRNTTPILLAPMHVAKMDTGRFWKTIQRSIDLFDLSSPSSLPVVLATFIYLYQRRNGVNHVYLGCNDDVLACSADELLQFWNEGINKNGNDISMSRYFGLLRDSHLNIEGILANARTKLGVFLLRDDMSPSTLHPMISKRIDPIKEEHRGLVFGDEEKILAEANYQRFSEVMPAIKILVRGELTMDHAAVLGQLWSDATFFYSRLVGVDPGSNPEVKYVRDRAAKLLKEGAMKLAAADEE